MESAIYSNQGDEYQRLIALHWVVRLLSEDDLDWVQIEAIACPVDDIVIGYKDGQKAYIQAKKNQPDYKAWSLSDLKSILISAGKQLKKDPDGFVYLYSRTPFGDINKLRESVRNYETFPEFQSNASETVRGIFNKFETIIGASSEDAFRILKQIVIGEHHDFDGWERIVKKDLRREFPLHNRVYDLLMQLITKQSARLGACHKYTKDYLLNVLKEQGLYQVPLLEEAEIIKQLRAASRIGRNYDMKIGGREIPRSEVQNILDSIKEGKNSVLVTGKKGSGKTWILLELAEQIEKFDSMGLLFIKGDQFDDVYSEEELKQRLHFEYDPYILISRLSENRNVVVIIDSLDALSLARDQKPLKLFLSFIDRVLALENVTTVLTCRDFDLAHDPQLRNRKWDIKIPLPLFDFENDVKPILEMWGIDYRNINENQKILLSHPQNLKLYEKMYKKIPVASIITEFHIIKLFFEETVEKNVKLRREVIQSLESMANKLHKKRSLFMPMLQFTGTEEVIRILSSEGVLTVDPIRDRIAFSHQALLDYLMIRSYVKEDKSLLEFILTHPQLPFIRPAIRSFLFYLHSMDNNDFSREIIRILKDDRVAYHVKRLIVESLTEISPITEIELNLIKNIHKNHPGLFNRFLLKNTSTDWFDAMHPELTQTILTNKENDTTKNTLIFSLEKWMNVRPEKIIECWNYVLNTPEPLFVTIIWMRSDVNSGHQITHADKLFS